MKYLKLSELYEELSGTTKRLEKIKTLSKFLKNLSESDRDVMYLLLGDIYPEYDERRIGISNQLAIKAISKATGIEEKKVTKEWKEIGDLGKVAEFLTAKRKQSTLHSHILTTEKVLENLRKLPYLEGKGTVNKKLSLIIELLTSASPIEALYLIRTLIGDLRIGVKESTIRDAMTEAFFEKSKKSSEIMQKAIDKANDLSVVFEIAKKGKLSELKRVSLKIGHPIKAMLPKKVKNIKEGFKEVGKPCAIEFKYDGFRMLIHKKKDEILVFTRSLENVTKQFPEVVEYIKKYVKGETFILDCEAVGYDKKTKEYRPFQDISQRIRRKYDIDKLQKQLPIELNLFDILYYNGKSVLDDAFEKRTKLLRKIVTNHPYKIITSKQLITGDEKKAEEFYKKALKANQEGIMMKNMKSPYRPGRRVGNMIKMKPEERDLDLVITGAEYGTGKRSGWMSSFILSCQGKNKGEYLEIGKMGTGIKEKAEKGMSFDQLTKLVKPHIIEEKGKTVKIKPKIVLAVTYQEIQRSPNYNSGFALRFPRFTALRPDKPLSEITTLNEIKKDFENQKRNWRYG
ncbi:MAG TPA: ATP-dependent DNA ligase [Bacillota bacterium]|nr:ATP-dependent DNA ligase [Bacillota bacterium]